MINLKQRLFQNYSTKQTIIKNTFWLSASQIGSRLIRAAILIYAARILGTYEYGVFSYVLGLAGFFTIFADIGISQLLTREIASHKDKRLIYFANAFWIKIILLLITSLLIIFVAPKFSKIESAKILMPLVSVFVIFDNFREFIFAYFRGIERMELETLITVIMNVTIAIAGFLILYFSKTATALLYSYVISTAITSIITFYFVKDYFEKIIKKFNKKVFKKFLSDSWLIAFGGVFGIFMINIDTVILGWWRTPQEIGYYSAGQRIIQIFYTLPTILSTIIFPTISRFIKNNDKEKTRFITEKTITVLYFVALPLAIGGIILAKPILEFFFGKEYLPGSLSFQIFCGTLLINFPSAILNSLTLAYNYQKKLFKYLVLGSMTNVIFDLLLIPHYGIAGSAIATLFSQIVFYVPVWLSIKHKENFNTLKHLNKIIISSIIMGIISFTFNILDINIILNIAISSIAYFGMLYFMKEKIFEDLKPILNVIKK